MKVKFEYKVSTNGKILLQGNGESNTDTIMISNINKKCMEYGVSFTDFIETLINHLTMDEVENILIEMSM